MHASMSRRVVIVGGGHAGGSAARALREAGHAGPITLIGEESHPPYERPPLSKDLLHGKVAAESTYLASADWYTQQGIELRCGCRALAIDRARQQVILNDGSAVAYDALLLTTGARARRLQLPGADSPRVHVLRSIDDALRLRTTLEAGRHIAIVGGGFVGLEVAAIARARGASVTLLEVAPHVLARVAAPELALAFEQMHSQHGVDVRTSTQLLSMEDDGRSMILQLGNGDRLAVDAVLVGIGSQPNSELADEAGIGVRDGIIVDEFGRTSDPHIWAAGDVTQHFNPLLGRHLRLESFQNAKDQAIAVAHCIAGGTQPYAKLPWFWSDQYDTNFQTVGAPQGWDKLVWRGRPEDGRCTLFYLQDDVPVAAATLNNGRDIRPASQLLLARRAVDAARLADPGLKLQALAAAEAILMSP
jgi:3-phenylpropionate/trans-cinnamate dioxygenase ferredoxin reductase subunit